MFSLFCMSSENFRLQYMLWTVTLNECDSNKFMAIVQRFFGICRHGIYRQFRKRSRAQVCAREEEEESWQSGACFPSWEPDCRKVDSWTAERPKVPTSGVLLLSAGPLRSERCCFLGCSKPLHIYKKKEKGFQMLLSSEKHQKKVELSMQR